MTRQLWMRSSMNSVSSRKRSCARNSLSSTPQKQGFCWCTPKPTCPSSSTRTTVTWAGAACAGRWTTWFWWRPSTEAASTNRCASPARTVWGCAQPATKCCLLISWRSTKTTCAHSAPRRPSAVCLKSWISSGWQRKKIWKDLQCARPWTQSTKVTLKWSYSSNPKSSSTVSTNLSLQKK